MRRGPMLFHRGRRPAILAAAGGLALCVVLARRSDAFVALRFAPAGTFARWEAARFPLAFLINDRTATGMVSNVAAGSDVMGAIRAAIRAWQELPTASIRFAETVTTSIDSASGDDGVNLITMANTPVNVSITGGANGALALTRLIFNPSTGRIFES